MSDVTQILNAIDVGDPQAAEQLLPVVYDELRKLAAAQVAHEKPGQTLDATALVHEAYIRLIGACGASKGEVESLASAAGSAHFANRRHFFAAAAQAMRRILIENARRKARIRHGGGQHRVELPDVAVPMSDEQVLDLDEALTRLAGEDPLCGRVVELRQFVGLGREQIAEVLGITVYQARQKRTYARAWLHQALSK